ncbi:MAG: pilus assembly protein PilM [candidate division WOR-3 bacterium]|nr:pilus assembly protein PilM [candidate division WOR-3 bacterium]
MFGLLQTKGKKILAIDIGSAAIKYIKASGGKIIDYGVREIAEVFDIPSILKELSAEFAPDEILSFVSGPAVSIRHAPFPRMNTKELRDAIYLRLDRYSPFTADEAILDFTVTSDIREAGVIRDNVTIVAARRDIVSEHIATFKKAGLEPSTISVVPLALAGAVKRYARLRPNEVVCVIDVGSQFTTLVFMRNMKLDLTRSLTIAGNAITESMTVPLATEYGELVLNAREAEEYKRQYGIPAADAQENLPSGIPVRYLRMLQEPVLARLVAEINRSIDYYRREFTVPAINRIILCGGGACMKNFREYLESALGIPTELFDPFKTHNLYRRDRPFTENLGTRLVAVLGILTEPSAINLLPRELKARREYRTDVALVTTLAILVIPALIVINFLLALQTNLKKRERERYARRLKSLEVMNTEYYDLKSDIGELENKLKSLKSVVGEESKTIPVLRELSFIVPDNIKLNTFSLTKEQGVKISGLVSSSLFSLDLDLVQFMMALEASPYFKNVKLVSKTRKAFGTETVLDFEISSELEAMTK